jgi:hypothetical protein
MAAYSYSEIDDAGAFIEGGETRLFFYAMRDDKPRIIEADGKLWMRDIGADHRKAKHSYGATWPMTCEALAVSPDQIREQMAEDAKRGVKVEYARDGSPVFDSPGIRKRYCEAYGFYDRNASYSDPQRGAFRERFG